MRRIHLIGLVCLLGGPLAITRPADEAPAVAFPFQPGDRVAWIGSSSTRIGVWPKTMEFLLRTRHPERIPPDLLGHVEALAARARSEIGEGEMR